MKAIAITEARRALGALINAVQREPFVIRRRGRDVAAVLSVAEFDRLKGERGNELRNLMRDVGRRAAARGLAERKLAEILARAE